MNSVRSNSPSLNYQGFPPLGCQDIRIRKFEFVAKTQFLNLEEDDSYSVMSLFPSVCVYTLQFYLATQMCAQYFN